MARDFLQMLAPHMIVGLDGPRLAGAERTLLSKYPFPGVILFERNVADARQLMELVQEIRSVFRDSRGTAPLVAADHEGGVVSVLARAIGVPPTQMAAARAGRPDLVERLYAENARRMRACGVNLFLGPVADVNSDPLNPVIGTRSFGEETGLVSSLVSVAVAASRREGALTCLKHFPGHGPSRVDSHLELPVLGATLDQLRERDIPPFASGIAAGAESVMIGHIAPLGRALPASLDPEIIGRLLRGELGFEGVIMTDALEMEGVKGGGSLIDICGRALAAGNDILLFSKPVAGVADDLAFLRRSRRSGRMPGCRSRERGRAFDRPNRAVHRPRRREGPGVRASERSGRLSRDRRCIDSGRAGPRQIRGRPALLRTGRRFHGDLLLRKRGDRPLPDEKLHHAHSAGIEGRRGRQGGRGLFGDRARALQPRAVRSVPDAASTSRGLALFLIGAIRRLLRTPCFCSTGGRFRRRPSGRSARGRESSSSRDGPMPGASSGRAGRRSRRSESTTPRRTRYAARSAGAEPGGSARNRLTRGVFSGIYCWAGGNSRPFLLCAYFPAGPDAMARQLQK